MTNCPMALACHPQRQHPSRDLQPRARQPAKDTLPSTCKASLLPHADAPLHVPGFLSSSGAELYFARSSPITATQRIDQNFHSRCILQKVTLLRPITRCTADTMKGEGPPQLGQQRPGTG